MHVSLFFVGLTTLAVATGSVRAADSEKQRVASANVRNVWGACC